MGSLSSQRLCGLVLGPRQAGPPNSEEQVLMEEEAWCHFPSLSSPQLFLYLPYNSTS